MTWIYFGGRVDQGGRELHGSVFPAGGGEEFAAHRGRQTTHPHTARERTHTAQHTAVAMVETSSLVQIVVVFCCLVGLWVKGGQEPVQGYIFGVSFLFLCSTMFMLEGH